jgi:hypothetical protein
MQNVKLISDVLDVARTRTDRWYVTNGATAVGPVNLDLLARGVEAGKVPISSFVRHEAWKVWRPLCEIAEITTEDGAPAYDLGRASYEPGRMSVELISSELEDVATDDVFAAAWTAVPREAARSCSSNASSEATDRSDALLLLLAAAVSRGHAEVVMIHQVEDDGAVAVCAYGPQLFEALGLRTRLLDPALLAAAAGTIVISEPSPGPAGQAIIERLSRLGGAIESAVMLPIRPHGRLFGTIELGRRSAFRASDIAGFETLVDALVLKLEAMESRHTN